MNGYTSETRLPNSESYKPFPTVYKQMNTGSFKSNITYELLT